MQELNKVIRLEMCCRKCGMPLLIKVDTYHCIYCRGRYKKDSHDILSKPIYEYIEKNVDADVVWMYDVDAVNRKNSK